MDQLEFGTTKAIAGFPKSWKSLTLSMSKLSPIKLSFPNYNVNFKGSQSNPWFKAPKINSKLPSNVVSSSIKIKSFTINFFKEEIYLADNKGNIIVSNYEGDILATHSICGFKIK